MSRRALFAILSLLPATAGWSLDSASQKLADRYETILRANPANATALERLWKIHEAAGETESLTEKARNIANTEPVLAARILQRAGKTDEALKTLAPLAVQQAVAARLSAQWLKEKGNTRDAATALEIAGKATNDASLWMEAAECWRQTGQMDRCRAAWAECMRLAPHDLALREKLAQAATAAEEPATALQHWQVIITEGTAQQQLMARKAAGELQERSGNLDAAIHLQEEIISMMGPGYWELPPARQRLFTLSKKAGKLDQLEARLLRRAAEHPQETDAARELVEYYRQSNNNSERLKWLSRTLALTPQDAGILREKMLLEIMEGRQAEAVETSAMLHAQSPADIETAFIHAELLANLGREQEAVMSVMELVQNHRDDAEVQKQAREFFIRLHIADPLEQILITEAKLSAKKPDATIGLMEFYLKEKKFPSVTLAAKRFDLKALPKTEAEAAALRFATFFRNSQMEEEALAWARQMLTINPSSLDGALAAAEILQTLNRRVEGNEILLKTAEASLSQLPAEETDRRVFLFLKASEPGDPLQLNNTNAAVKKMLTGLQTHAVQSNSESAWIRVSRWRQWNGEPLAAEESLRKGLANRPSSPVLTEALADVLIANKQFDAAIQQFHQLIQLAPERAVEIQRKIGLAEVNNGQSEEAIRTFQAIATANPHDWQAVADLANALQAGENWFAAMEKWAEAHSLAPAESRRALRQPLLTAAVRLQLTDRALDFLEQACASEKNPQAREELFREAAVFAVQQHVADKWQERLTQRATAPQGDIWKQGLPILFNEKGIPAIEPIPPASETAETQAALEIAVKQAEQAGRNELAAAQALKLAKLGKPMDSVPWQRYADLLEASGQIPEAGVAWQDIARRFPRDSEVLSRAAEFFTKWENDAEAEKCLRQLANLGACTPQQLLSLSRKTDNREQAVADLETLLATTRPDLKGKPVLPYPAELTVPATTIGNDTWPRAAITETEGCRLAAIQQLGRFFINSPGRQKWANAFSHSMERIWAWYSIGETRQALAEAAQVAGKANIIYKENFAALAIASGRGTLLAEWAATDPEEAAEAWKAAVSGFGFLLDQNWIPHEETLQGLSAKAPAIVRWGICQQLASHGYYSMACHLGRNVPEQLPHSMATQTWVEFAGWRMALRQPSAAREALDRALDVEPETASYTEPIFGALRTRWLLTSKDARPAFEKQMAERLKSFPSEKRASAAALLSALHGDDEDASSHLDTLFARIDFSAGGTWADAIQQGGRVLEQWNLNRLARDLYRHYLNLDAALLTLDGENFQKETENFLVQNKLLTVEESSMPYLLTMWKVRGASQEDLLQTARRIAGAGSSQKAGIIVNRLDKEYPASDSVASGVLAYFQDQDQQASLQEYIQRILMSPGSSLSKTMAANAALRLAVSYQQSGNYSASLRLLDSIKKEKRTAVAASLRQAQLLRDLGRFPEAIAVLEQAPDRDGGTTALFLAELYANTGREPEARRLLMAQLEATKPNRVAVATMLKRLAELSGDSVALEKTKKILDDEIPSSSTAERNWQRERALLTLRFSVPEERFRAGAKYLTENASLPEAEMKDELARLNRLAQEHPALQPQYFLLRKALAARSHATESLERELRREWKGGKGNYLAGEILIQFFLEEHRETELATILKEYLDNTDFRLVAWQQLATALLNAGHPDAAERVLVKLRSYSDGNTSTDLMMAEALWRQGKPAEFLLEPIRQIAEVEAGVRLELAWHYLRLERIEQARQELLRLAEGGTVDRQTAEGWILLADKQINRGALGEARDTLSFLEKHYPGQIRGSLVANYQEATGEISSANPTTPPCRLGSAATREWQVEICKRLVGKKDFEHAFFWIEKNPGLVADSRIRESLREMERADGERTRKLLDMAAEQTSLWAIRKEAAQAHLRRGQELIGSEQAPLSEFEKAFLLDPGCLPIATAYADELLRLKKPSQAEKALERAIKSPSPPEERAAIREKLERLKTSPSLPGKSG